MPAAVPDSRDKSRGTAWRTPRAQARDPIQIVGHREDTSRARSPEVGVPRRIAGGGRIRLRLAHAPPSVGNLPPVRPPGRCGEYGPGLPVAWAGERPAARGSTRAAATG